MTNKKVYQNMSYKNVMAAENNILTTEDKEVHREIFYYIDSCLWYFKPDNKLGRVLHI